MSIPGVGWAFAGFSAVALLGYILHRGVFVGADVELQISGGPPWPKYCNYLDLRGISQEAARPFKDPTHAEATSCSFLRKPA